MVGVDTNIIVRILTRDHPDQFERARSLLEREQVYVPDTVILETVWVLESLYGFTPAQISDGLAAFFGLKQVVLEDAQRIAAALAWFRGGMDFADALHLAACQSLGRFKTFDKAFIRLAGQTDSACTYEPVQYLFCK